MFRRYSRPFGILRVSYRLIWTHCRLTLSSWIGGDPRIGISDHGLVALGKFGGVGIVPETFADELADELFVGAFVDELHAEEAEIVLLLFEDSTEIVESEFRLILVGCLFVGAFGMVLSTDSRNGEEWEAIDSRLDDEGSVLSLLWEIGRLVGASLLLFARGVFGGEISLKIGSSLRREELDVRGITQKECRINQ